MPLGIFDFDNSLQGQMLLIVENENAERLKYEEYGKDLGMTVISVASKKHAIEMIDAHAIDCVFCDLHLATEAGIDIPDGLEIISAFKEVQPQAYVVAMSSDPRRDMGDRALAAGAHHFARKPMVSIEDFKIALRLASQRKTLSKTQQTSGGEIFKKYPEGIVIDPDLRHILSKLAKRPDIYLNIVGETGSGKELVAKLFHSIRVSAEGPLPLVIVNCAQLNPSIAASELFGHKRGSFTGAAENTIGFIGEAHRGILFLDEIHLLDTQVQAKLLRVLNDGTYTRVGDTQTRTSQFQLMTASTKDLDELALAGQFSMDLKIRIDGYAITLPPLRERRKDIPDLLRLALARNGKNLSDRKIVDVSNVLSSYQWAGNIRQFMKVVNSWILHCDIHDLPLEAQYVPVTATMKAMPSNTQSVLPISIQDAPLPAAMKELAYALKHDRPLQETIDAVEKALIVEAVARHKTLGEAAEALDLSRSSFDARRRKYELVGPG